MKTQHRILKAHIPDSIITARDVCRRLARRLLKYRAERAGLVLPDLQLSDLITFAERGGLRRCLPEPAISSISPALQAIAPRNGKSPSLRTVTPLPSPPKSPSIPFHPSL